MISSSVCLLDCMTVFVKGKEVIEMNKELKIIKNFMMCVSKIVAKSILCAQKMVLL